MADARDAYLARVLQYWGSLRPTQASVYAPSVYALSGAASEEEFYSEPWVPYARWEELLMTEPTPGVDRVWMDFWNDMVLSMAEYDRVTNPGTPRWAFQETWAGPDNPCIVRGGLWE